MRSDEPAPTRSQQYTPSPSQGLKECECPVMFPAEFENSVLSMATVISMFDVPPSVSNGTSL